MCVFPKMLAIFHWELSLVCSQQQLDQNGQTNKLCHNLKSRAISQRKVYEFHNKVLSPLLFRPNTVVKWAIQHPLKLVGPWVNFKCQQVHNERR